MGCPLGLGGSEPRRRRRCPLGDLLVGSVGSADERQEHRQCRHDGEADEDDSKCEPGAIIDRDPAEAEEGQQGAECDDKEDELNPVDRLVLAVVRVRPVDRKTDCDGEHEQEDQKTDQAGKSAEQVTECAESFEEVDALGDRVVAEGDRRTDHEDQCDDEPGKSELGACESKHCSSPIFP